MLFRLLMSSYVFIIPILFCFSSAFSHFKNFFLIPILFVSLMSSHIFKMSLLFNMFGKVATVFLGSSLDLKLR